MKFLKSRDLISQRTYGKVHNLKDILLNLHFMKNLKNTQKELMTKIVHKGGIKQIIMSNYHEESKIPFSIVLRNFYKIFLFKHQVFLGENNINPNVSNSATIRDYIIDILNNKNYYYSSDNSTYSEYINCYSSESVYQMDLISEEKYWLMEEYENFDLNQNESLLNLNQIFLLNGVESSFKKMDTSKLANKNLTSDVFIKISKRNLLKEILYNYFTNLDTDYKKEIIKKIKKNISIFKRLKMSIMQIFTSNLKKLIKDKYLIELTIKTFNEDIVKRTPYFIISYEREINCIYCFSNEIENSISLCEECSKSSNIGYDKNESKKCEKCKNTTKLIVKDKKVVDKEKNQYCNTCMNNNTICDISKAKISTLIISDLIDNDSSSSNKKHIKKIEIENYGHFNYKSLSYGNLVVELH